MCLIRLNLNYYCHISKLIPTYLTNTYISISKSVFRGKEMEGNEEGFGGTKNSLYNKMGGKGFGGRGYRRI